MTRSSCNTASFTDDESRYGAVVDRDRSADGQFFYAVTTTGVYCHPSCASRSPNRENVRFYDSAAAAEAAGFRACRRCRPDTWASDLERLAATARYIEAHADETLPLKVLAERVDWSPTVLQKKFKALFGASPKVFRDAARMGRLKELLRESGDVTAAIFEAGFGSTSRVYERSARNLGMTPAAYRRGGQNETIFHAYRTSSLGPMLMAATARGICFVQFGESRDELLEMLAREFPKATLTDSPAAASPALDDWMAALEQHLTNGGPKPDLPLDLRGTAFQLKVWRFLLGVADGATVSYGDVARGIGQPRAVRAAASACGRNRVAVLVPCHRVLRGDGGLGGYRWGLDRKRTLLDAERRRASR